jgi:hypothetical protein
MSKKPAQGVQLSLFDIYEPIPREIICSVERPDGSTYEQIVALKSGETGAQAKARFQKTLGDPFGWYIKRGQKCRYVKRNAYLVTSWRWKEKGGE